MDRTERAEAFAAREDAGAALAAAAHERLVNAFSMDPGIARLAKRLTALTSGDL